MRGAAGIAPQRQRWPSRRLFPILLLETAGTRTLAIVTNMLERLQSAVAERYTIEREIGRGGMATVYLARDLKHDRAVALKVLRPELGALLGTERFLREIKLVARLQHPHILPLYDSGSVDGLLYYVMPFVVGESLRDRLKREKQLPLRDALRIAREVADALYYAHSHDIVHRDIKPENILLSGDHAIVADFGIARAVHVAGGEQWETLTESGASVGTPAYMSPEQFSGDRAVDGRSDIYSLGCVLHEMLVGEPPFTGPDGTVTIARRFTDAPPRVREVRDSVPVTVDDALCKALAREPADRFANALEFAEALWATPSPTLSNMLREPRREATRWHRGRWLGAGGLAAVAALAALSFMTLRGKAGAPDSPPPGLAPDTSVTPEVPTVTHDVPTRSAAAPPVPTPQADSIRQADRKPAATRRKAPSTSRTPPTTTPKPIAPRAAIQREDSVWRSVRAAALDAKRRALVAGAPASSLAPGDTQLTTAESLAARGHLSEAVAPLLNATSIWAEAERAARAREKADTQTADTQQVSAETPAPQPPSRPRPPPPGVADPRAGVAAAIGAYARAIESGEVAAIRRSYPGLTVTQQEQFEEFFSAVSNLQVRLTVEQLRIVGDTAEVRIGGTYTYQDRKSHKPGAFPVALQATLRRDTTGWRLISIR